jgi:nitrogen fixation/metabolism regulation signal transduction histidine kinase
MTASIPSEPSGPGGRKQRRLRNYLLDYRFQLKYTAFLVGIAVVLSGVLGSLLWSVSRDVISQSQQTVRRGQQTVSQGQDVIRESQKVSAVVRMNIVKDPVYADNPELLAVFNASAVEQDRRLDQQQEALRADAERLEQRAEELVGQQRRMFAVLVVALSILVGVVGVAGIVVTHRVAGPVFKMKGLLRHVGNGHLNLRGRLRKNDELHHFYEAFEHMVQSLRRRKESEIEGLDRAIADLESSVPNAELAPLRALREQMHRTLDLPDPSSSMPAPPGA